MFGKIDYQKSLKQLQLSVLKLGASIQRRNIKGSK